jgi:hypothetical protein
MQQFCDSADCTADIRRADAARGMRLCKPCRDRLTRHLGKLPELYAACEKALEVRWYAFAPRSRGKSHDGLRLNERAVRVRGDMVSVLSSWAMTVLDERSITRPGSTRVESLVSFLTGQIDWLAAHAAAGEFAAEVARLVDAAGSVLEPASSRQIDLGACVEDGCDGRLTARLRVLDGAARDEVGCDAGHTWPLQHWLLLGRRIEQLRTAGRAPAAL